MSSYKCEKCKTTDRELFEDNTFSICKDCDESCKICGKSKEDTEFYQHNKSTCKSCCIKRNKVNRLTFNICPEMKDFCIKIGKDWDELCKLKNQKTRETDKQQNIVSQSDQVNISDDIIVNMRNKYEGLNNQFKELELDNANLNEKCEYLSNKLNELIESHKGHLMYMNTVFKKNNLVIPKE